MHAFVQALLAVRCGAPAVAYVDGEARGGGVGLAAACDLVLATPRATFALPEALFGLVPGAIRPILEERMAPQKVRRLALLAGSIGAEEALALGLVDRIVADESEAAGPMRALARAERGAALQIAHDPGLERAVRAGARRTLQRLHHPATGRRLAAWLDGYAPWEAA